MYGCKLKQNIYDDYTVSITYCENPQLSSKIYSHRHIGVHNVCTDEKLKIESSKTNLFYNINRFIIFMSHKNKR